MAIVVTKWDYRFLKLAHHISTWSTCLKRNVGAVLVKDKHILTTGYNGAPRGLTPCTDINLCPRISVPSGHALDTCRATHAEQNAIIQAALHGVNVSGATLYCTAFPCIHCTKMLINAGIVRVVYDDEYNIDDNAIDFFEKAGIEICCLKTHT